MGEKQEDGLIGTEKTLTCPHCHEPIHVVVRTQVVEAVRVIERRGKEDGRLGLTPEKTQALEVAKEAGLITAFEAAVNRRKNGTTPKNIERYFLTFLDKARPVKVPGFVLKKAMQIFPDTRIEIRASDGIAALLTDGVIRGFVPQATLMGTTISGSNMRTSVRLEEVEEWIRTRWGFVAGKGFLFAELQQSCFGGFAL